MTGIYIHIPFCKQRCGYCDFCSTSNYTEGFMDEYMMAIIRQMDDFFDKSSKIKLDTVYFGGGTPSVFGGKRIAKLIKELSKRVDIVKGAEITVEANPESCDKGFCKALKGSGVNRISLGVQSANDDELKKIGRLHTFEQAAVAVEVVRKYLTDNISLDLIFGLPEQSMEIWELSVEKIAGLNPTHISAYGLKLESGCPMYGQKLDLPDDDMQADMYLKAVEILENKGYKQYEVSNFAREGRVSRHNVKYWELEDYIGMGAGAHGLYGGKRYSFTSDILDFVEKSKGNESPIDEKEDFSVELRYRKGEYIMLMLRTVKGIDEEQFYKLFKEDFAPYAERMRGYLDNGYAIHDGLRYYLTPKGFLISNKIIGDVLGDI